MGFNNGFAPNKWQAIIWTNADPIHWSVYVAQGGDELTHLTLGCAEAMIQVYSLFKLILQIDIFSITREIGLRWVPPNVFNEKSVLV